MCSKNESTTDVKTCSSCKETKPIFEFWHNRYARDGLLCHCKNCRRARRLLTIDRQKKRDESRRYYERNHFRIIENVRAYRKTNKQRVRAWNAVRENRPIKQPCEICGSSATEAHHDDYSRPLDIRWLCRIHHREHHACQIRLLKRARKRYGEGITPCSGRNWGECFKDHGRYGYALYFNTPDGSTHIEREGGEAAAN